MDGSWLPPAPTPGLPQALLCSVGSLAEKQLKAWCHIPVLGKTVLREREMHSTAGGQGAARGCSPTSAALGSEARPKCRSSQGSCVRAAATQDVGSNAGLQLEQGEMFLQDPQCRFSMAHVKYSQLDCAQPARAAPGNFCPRFSLQVYGERDVFIEKHHHLQTKLSTGK